MSVDELPPKGFIMASLHPDAELGDLSLPDSYAGGLTREPSTVPCPYCRRPLDRRRLEVGGKVGRVARIVGVDPQRKPTKIGWVSEAPAGAAVFSCPDCRLRFIALAHFDAESSSDP